MHCLHPRRRRRRRLRRCTHFNNSPRAQVSRHLPPLCAAFWHSFLLPGRRRLHHRHCARYPTTMWTISMQLLIYRGDACGRSGRRYWRRRRRPRRRRPFAECASLRRDADVCRNNDSDGHWGWRHADTIDMFWAVTHRTVSVNCTLTTCHICETRKHTKAIHFCCNFELL